jgi:hypothetical protein
MPGRWCRARGTRRPARWIARVEQRFLGQRAGGDEAHDVARDQCLGTAALLCFLGAFHLLGNGHAATGADQAGKVAFGRMDRHPAHRDRRAAMLAPAGEGDIENLRGLAGIVEEQLEEIAHAVEQQAIGRLVLERQVLRHHRGGSGGHAQRG